MKELSESQSVSSFRSKYELGRSFDLEDDLEFCPGLVTESDVSILDLAQNMLCYRRADNVSTVD